MIRRPPRSTLDRSSAAADVYKRQAIATARHRAQVQVEFGVALEAAEAQVEVAVPVEPVSYTHLRAHETVLDIVCRLLLEKTKNNDAASPFCLSYTTTNSTASRTHISHTSTIYKTIVNHVE